MTLIPPNLPLALFLDTFRGTIKLHRLYLHGQDVRKFFSGRRPLLSALSVLKILH